MPTTISLQQTYVWFCVGLFTGLGWALGTYIIGRLFR